MKRSVGNPLLVLACLALALASATALAACGSDDDAQQLTFELEGSGKDLTYVAPESAESGEAEITLVNNSDEEGELQLIRVDGDHSAAETIKGLENAQSGKPLPDWFFAGGGIGVLQAGEEKTVTQVLEPGTYYGFNLTQSSPPDPASVPALEVSGDESDVELSADATVEAAEYQFTAENLGEGENEIDFINGGAQPHHLIISKIKGDATLEEVENAFKEEKGPPPIEEEPVFDAAVIEGGESQLVTADLEPGRYALLCFISDRQGGPPHVVKGMIDELVIE